MLKLNNINSKNIFYFAVLLSLLLLFPVLSVAAKTGETEQKVQVEKENTNGATAEKKERKYIYNPIGKTDPFKSFIVLQEQNKKEKDEKPRTYLETLELSQLNISLIIIGKEDSWAMVTDNKGEGHVIKIGTPIGINRGVVYKIQSGEVIIKEEFRNYKDEKEIRYVSKKAPSGM